MAYWSPALAMKAYLDTLHLCRKHSDEDSSNGSTTLVEPKWMEFISALAAGKRARMMVEIASEGISPLTISLAVAAKHTGGKLVCILFRQEDIKKSKQRLKVYDSHLQDVIQFVHGNPLEVIMKYKNIDLIVIDGKLTLENDSDLKIWFKRIHFKPSGDGAILVRHNTRHGVSFSDVLNGNAGVRSETLPMGEGMELIRIRSVTKRENRRCKRFHAFVKNINKLVFCGDMMNLEGTIRNTLSCKVIIEGDTYISFANEKQNLHIDK
ncbi:unnamed protein product [Dovyalis caffra]|uniref:Uncharacterized protein n=1 Tax=Dovyalis caffra TaxID=77055 RepID=A0AAV1R4A5_9ROSI|nr:unnamed protein product [Dovyalis caffra]